MILGLGIDVVDIPQMKELLRSEAFIRKVFSEAEIEICTSLANSAECFAGKFAAKEACMKAVGRGICQGVWFTQIEVLNAASGAPYLQVSKEMEKSFLELGVRTAHLSLTHSRQTAAAVVVLEK